MKVSLSEDKRHLVFEVPVKHGRCLKTPPDDMWFIRDLRSGWRREHAARVFQAIQAVVAVSCLEMAHANPGAGCQTLGHVGECCYRANWLWNNNPYFWTRNP